MRAMLQMERLGEGLRDEDGLARGLDCSQEGWELGLRLIHSDDLHNMLPLLLA